MAPQLGALAILEDTGLSPSIHTVTHNHLQCQFQGIEHSLPASTGTRHKSGTQTYKQAKQPYA